MPVELMRGFEKAFGCKVLEGYGLSESSPVASFNHPDRERKPGSIGTPIEGVEMKVVDDDGNEVAQGEVGEIVIKGHNVMNGYWNRPEATEETIVDGWLHTGDIGKIDEDGYFFIVDRKKELIIRGGYNVYPREIEEVLYEHPDVREAAVLGVPHDEYGEEVGAAVALKDGGTRHRPTSCARSSRTRSPPTSTRARCGWSTSCPRARPARSSSARSSRPTDDVDVRPPVAVRPATPADVEQIHAFIVELAVYERAPDAGHRHGGDAARGAVRSRARRRGADRRAGRRSRSASRSFTAPSPPGSACRASGWRISTCPSATAAPAPAAPC